MKNILFQALADKTRRQILELLKEKDMTAGGIAEKFNISKPSISHHLNILKNSELVLCERKGQEMIYSLNVTVLQEFMLSLFETFKKERE